MTSKNNNFRPPDNKKPRQRLLFRRIIQILFISASIIFISYIWIIPALIRWKIEIRLSEICGGPVQAGRLRIYLVGRVFLDSVSIYDKSGREWLSAGKIKVSLAGWPGLRPKIQEVLIGSLDLQISSTNGKMNLPQLNLPARTKEAHLHSITRTITIKKAAVSIMDEQDSQGVSGGLAFSINPAFTVRLDGQRLDVNDFAATVCDGPVIGQFHAEVKDSRSIEYQGQILATEVNYPKFTSTFGINSAGTAGSSFSGSYGFAGRNDDPNAFHGEGVVLLNDTDISVLPVIAAIFEFIGLSRIEPLKISDAEAKFHNTGSLVTIESGHISNLFAAIEFEPGGTLDLNTKQIDAYVVAAPLGQITGLIEKLPVIEIFANLKDKLMRLHVKGNWSDPPGDLIKKEPIKDLKESTVGFLRDVTKTGGQFGQGMIDGLSNLLKPKNKENK